jgi:SprT protein
MKQRILDKVEEAFLNAESFYNKKFSRPTTILFETKGSTAGHCHYGRRELMFQIAIAERDERFLNDIPAHEVAHYVEKEVYGYQYKQKGRKLVRDIHGKNWKFIMRYVMRLDPDRCHNYDVKGFVREVERKRFKYSCTQGHTLNLSSVVHNRIVRGTHKYRCKCEAPISLKVLSNAEQIAALQLRIQKLTNQIHA